MTARACDACLARAWLLGRLAGCIDVARRRRPVLRELLAMADADLIEALAPADARQISAEARRNGPLLRDGAIRAGLGTTCRHDAGYPARLRDLNDPPGALFVAGGDDPVRRLGELAGGTCDEGAPAVAIVGTRRASAEGVEVARGLGRGLAGRGVTVVSGMALGIDSAAHAGAVEAAGGTVAVLGGGADVPYPRTKRALYRQILERGCALSEMPVGFEPFRWSFPARNRLIAALSGLTVVVEAAERSGSLITAELAADLGREVAAVPGPVWAWRARGSNALLRDGATLIRDARDVLDSVTGVEPPEAAADPGEGLSPRLGSLLRAVSDGRDTLAALAGAPDQVQPTLAALAELELDGWLRRVPGGRYVVIPR